MNGHYSNDYGIKSAIEIENLYTAKEFSEKIVITNPNLKFIIIKVRKKTIDEFNGSLEEKIYQATKGNWRLKRENAEKYKIVLSVIDGVVREVFEIESWHATKGEHGRINFIGKIAAEEIRMIFKGFKIPLKYRKKGASSPTLYFQP